MLPNRALIALAFAGILAGQAHSAVASSCLCPCLTVTAQCNEPGIEVHSAELHERGVLFLKTQAPTEVRFLAGGVEEWTASNLPVLFSESLKAARCYSGGSPGPDDPRNVSPAAVKGWVVQVARAKAPMLSPLVERLDAVDVCNLWRRAVEIKRRKPFNFYGVCP
jgi:hypothetical protein